MGLSDQFTFSDLPVPQGYKLVRDQSYAYKDGQARIALLRYKGKGNIDDISWFYQQHMPEYRWEDVNIIDYDKNVQQFAKDQENALITIEKINEPFLFVIPVHKILVTIQLMPQRQEAASNLEPIPAQAEMPEPRSFQPASQPAPMPVLK